MLFNISRQLRATGPFKSYSAPFYSLKRAIQYPSSSLPSAAQHSLFSTNRPNSNKPTNQESFSVADTLLEEERKEQNSKIDSKILFLENILNLNAPPKKKIITVNALEFDMDGNIKVIEQEMNKSELCALHGLNRRDLKTIDRPLSNQAPSILVREKALIVNLTGIRALIKSDRVFIFDNPDEETHQHQSYLIHELQGKLKQKDASAYFELRALEAVFTTSQHSLAMTQSYILPQIEECLERLNTEVNQELLKTLLLLKNELTMFKANVEAIGAMYERVLNNDEDLVGMFLTDKSKKVKRAINEHMEAELLLEHYQGMVEEIGSMNRTTITTINSTESLIQLSLDTQRNKLILFDLRATLCGISLALSTFITSIYGMNLLSGMEEVGGFMTQVAVLAGTMGMTAFLLLTWRVKMMTSMKVGVASWIKTVRKFSDSANRSV